MPCDDMTRNLFPWCCSFGFGGMLSELLEKFAMGFDHSFGGRMLSGGGYRLSKTWLVQGLMRNGPPRVGIWKGGSTGKRHSWLRGEVKTVVSVFALLVLFLLFDSFMMSVFQSTNVQTTSDMTIPSRPKESQNSHAEGEQPAIRMYDRLLGLASEALAQKEFEQADSDFWNEPQHQTSLWKPCADQKLSTTAGKFNNGYILVSANGGLNQQRVAICNAVAVASLLNATLVIPRFLYSNVWKDPSQFGDIYQEDHFIKTLRDEVVIVKEVPRHLRFIDIEVMGSQITDADLEKEAKPEDYLRLVLPLLRRNGVVHLLGFGNRLGFDPIPFDLQRLRCKCNFHGLKFVPKIQRTGSLLLSRIKKFDTPFSRLDKQLLGRYIPYPRSTKHDSQRGRSKFLALHLRFEEDMVAYSQCDFGGGKDEEIELRAYRAAHFPLVLERLKGSKPVSPAGLRKLGRCPLTPEEAALILSGLGFKSSTYFYLAGSRIFGGKSRMHPLTSLYPNLVTKESLLTPSELSPFKNFSSQMAALDFIICATSDVFAMTDSGSQLSSLVSGFRMYYGGGLAPVIRPNKKRLAAILSKNGTVPWNIFEERIRKMILEGQGAACPRSFGRSIYRQPRSPECMSHNIKLNLKDQDNRPKKN